MSLKRKCTDLTPNVTKIALDNDVLSIVLGYYLTSDMDVTLISHALSQLGKTPAQIESSLSRVVTEWMKTTWKIKKYIPLHPRRALSHYVFPGGFSIDVLLLSAVERNDVPLLCAIHQTGHSLLPIDRRFALYRAIDKGYVQVLEYLHAAFGVTKRDMLENDFYLFTAAENGHLSTFQCLIKTYGVEKEIMNIFQMFNKKK